MQKLAMMSMTAMMIRRQGMITLMKTGTEQDVRVKWQLFLTIHSASWGLPTMPELEVCFALSTETVNRVAVHEKQ